jgi:nickel/cobalt transporter (NicO) family protein
MRFLADVQGWLYTSAVANLKAVASGIDPFQLLAAMAIAALFGLVHALMPGHGKTVLVSYYLGHPGRLLGSVGTSAILVATHVGSAIVLVLAGFTVLRATIGGAGRAPAFEVASAGLIVIIGVWLLFRALRPHRHTATDERVLAAATGFVPCPLTTFIMVYAATHGIIVAGLLVTASMAIGMIATIALFALAAVLAQSNDHASGAHGAPAQSSGTRPGGGERDRHHRVWRVDVGHTLKPSALPFRREIEPGRLWKPWPWKPCRLWT